MTPPILKTKLYTPSLKPKIVFRLRLIEWLNAGLATQSSNPAHKLTLVSAPADFGKTTLLSEWAAQYQHLVAWLSLDKSNDDPAHSGVYVVAALHTVPLDVEDVDQAMFQFPAHHQEPIFLLDHMLPRMHLVIATRVAPPLPLARLRGQTQLIELYQVDLHFTFKEAN